MRVVAGSVVRMRVLQRPEQHVTIKPGSYLWPDKIRESDFEVLFTKSFLAKSLRGQTTGSGRAGKNGCFSILA